MAAPPTQKIVEGSGHPPPPASRNAVGVGSGGCFEREKNLPELVSPPFIWDKKLKMLPQRSEVMPLLKPISIQICK